jgi:hypothetical protein
MATCNKCGNTYYSKECPYCNNKELYNQNKKINKKINKKLLLISIGVIIIISLVSYKTFFQNPLIGTWKTKQTIFGMNKIIFKKNTMNTMGIVSEIKYKIDGNTITVIDKMGTGMQFHLINKNKMYNELMGMKIIYKKID